MIRKLFVGIIAVFVLVSLFCIAIQFVPVSEPTPTPVAEPIEPINFAGQGGEVLPFTVARSGAVVISAEQTGEGHFWVIVSDSNGEPVNVLGNCFDTCQDEAVMNLGEGEYFLEVNSDAGWAITVTFP